MSDNTKPDESVLIISVVEHREVLTSKTFSVITEPQHLFAVTEVVVEEISE